MTNPSTDADTTAEALTGASSTYASSDRADRRDRLVLVAVAATSVALDVVSKVWASSALPGDPREIGPVMLRLVHNQGVAFGVASFAPPSAIVGITAVIAVAAAIAGWRGRLVPAFAAGLIVGGAAANVADRITGGTVVDFVDVGRWPVFNLADVSLLTGIGLLLFANRRREHPPHQ